MAGNVKRRHHVGYMLDEQRQLYYFIEFIDKDTGSKSILRSIILRRYCQKSATQAIGSTTITIAIEMMERAVYMKVSK